MCLGVTQNPRPKSWLDPCYVQGARLRTQELLALVSPSTEDRFYSFPLKVVFLSLSSIRGAVRPNTRVLESLQRHT